VVHPLGLQYSGSLRRQSSETAFSLGFIQNFPGGNDGRGTPFCLSRSATVNGHFECANGRYLVMRWSVNHSEQLPADWQGRFAMNGQLTNDMLIAGEQFGVGGVDSVRSFLEREVTNDQGHRGTVEIYTPDWASWTRIDGARMRFVWFYDWARVKRNRPGPGEIHGQSIAGTGLGIRFSRGNNFIFRTDYGQTRDKGGSQGMNDQRVTFSLSYVY
jgi:hemolysin activation/secretion protein